MKKTERVIVYPFDNYFNPILRYKELLNLDVEFVGLISPEGWGLCGKDASVTDNGLYINIIVSSDYIEMLNKCDTVWFSETESELSFETFIYPKIVDAIISGKNVISTVDLKGRKEEIKELCDKNNVTFTNLLDNESANFREIVSSRKIMNEFHVPIISVAGLIKDCGKFETQLALRNNFITQGYRVSQIGSRRGCEAFGFHSFPDFMFDERITANQRVVLLNNYIKNIENKENPDVIILGIPEGTMPVSNGDVVNFGVMAYMISQAVSTDITVLNILYEQGIDAPYFKRMYNTFKYRFGYEVKCFNVYNKSVDWNTAIIDRIVTYCTISKNNSKQLIEALDKEPDFKVFSLNSNIDTKDMTDYLIDTLAEYAEDLEILY